VRCGIFDDTDGSSEGGDGAEADDPNSNFSGEYSGSEYKRDTLGDQHHPLADLNDSRRTQSSRNYASELDNSDKGTHQNHHFQYDAGMQTRELDELFHCPWEDGHVYFDNQDHGTGSSSIHKPNVRGLAS
jgi:hypothetical protein